MGEHYEKRELLNFREIKTIMAKKKKNVPALEKCFRILDFLVVKGVPVASSEIAKSLDLPKSTVHGLLQTLIDHNVLKRGAEQKYFIGPHVMSWSNSFIASQNVVTLFQQEISKIQELNKYTLTLSVRERGEVVYLSCRNAEIPVGLSFRPGIKFPAPFPSTGKALLSLLSDKEIADIFSDGWPTPMTSNSVRGLDEFMEEVKIIRSRGFSIDNGQITEGMYCIGRVIRNEKGQPCAGIAVSLLKDESSEETTQHIVHLLDLLVTRIEGEMGLISVSKGVKEGTKKNVHRNSIDQRFP